MLGADGHREPPVEDVAQQRHHDQLLLEDAQHRADRLDGVERLGQAGRAAHEDLVGLHRTLEDSKAGAAEATSRSTSAVPLGRDGPALGRACPPDQVRGQQGTGVWPAPRRDVSASQLDGALLHRAVGEHHHQRARGRGESPTSWTERMVAVSCEGPTTTAAYEVSSESRPDGPLEHRLHLAVDLVEELATPARRWPGRGRPARSGGRRRSGSPCRSGCARRSCGAARGSPSRSSATISERTVAEETCTPGALATWDEPTGSAVPMYSVTTASRMAARRVVQGALVAGSVGERVGCASRAGSSGCLGTQVYRVPGPCPPATPAAIAPGSPGGGLRSGLSRRPGAARR